MPFLHRLRAVLSKPFLFFTLIMAVKLAVVWSVVFHGSGSSLWLMLATGIPSVWFLFCLVELALYRRKLGAYLVFDLILTGIYFAVIMYYKYFGVIVTFHELRQVNQVSDVNSSVISLLAPYYLFIFTDIVVLGGLLLFRRKARAWGRRIAVRGRRSWAGAGTAVSLAACIGSIVPHMDSMNEFMQAQGMGILNYEVYVAFAKPTMPAFNSVDVTQEKIDRAKGVAQPAKPALWQAAQGKNLIIIQLEAFQNFLIGLKIDGKEITPNMNALADRSYYFPHFFQQVGPGNTSDAEFVVNTSLYIPPNGAAAEIYADKALPSMPKRLAAAGYDTATFHTNDVSFWNRDQLYQALGWGTYYDHGFFGDEDPVMFAASDEVLYDKTAAKLAEMDRSGKPFYAQVISMSGHHPFGIPERKVRIGLPEQYRDTMVGDYLEAQNYADFALGQFIAKLKASGVWENSVVVLYGDHQGLPIYSLNSRERELMNGFYKREYGVTDMMNIPLIVSVPGKDGQQMEQIGGQSDIFPTAANLLGISLNDQLHFGQDLFNQTVNFLPQRYYLPSGSLITGQGAFVPGTGYEDGTVYPLNGGAASAGAVTRDEFERAYELIGMSDSYAASLPERKSAIKG
ncbi:LTA synthase family protein [Paenibacillus humicola]|uniref:LTA synthase family protein n=1 Tax=Paenibacillus humicola TaxID=3110540 RepID=UPI0030846CE4